MKIVAPEGYEIDMENSSFEKIVFKKSQTRWRDDTSKEVKGFYITSLSTIAAISGRNSSDNYNIFATEKLTKSALAMARISQIMANDPRFGGPVTDEEWGRTKTKYVIERIGNDICKSHYQVTYEFLAFHTPKLRDLFLEENEDLVKDYFMLD